MTIKTSELITDQLYGVHIYKGKANAPDHLKNKNNKYGYWQCSNCQKIEIKSNSNILRPMTKSCSCLKKPNLTDKKFGLLTAITNVPAPEHIKGKHNAYWMCKCDCGKELTVRSSELLACDENTSCGCKQIEMLSHSNPEEAKMASAKEIFKHYNNEGITFEQFYNLSQQPCFYCNASVELSSNYCNIFDRPGTRYASDFAKQHGGFRYNGLDRVNNNSPHTLQNCVPCCPICNRFKLHSDFKACIEKIDGLNPNPQFKFADQLNFVELKLKENNFNSLSQLFPQKNKSKHIYCTQKIIHIKKSAKRKKLEFSLTKLQSWELICAPCSYCETKIDPDNGYFSGIDRLNNQIGYTVDNSIPCCWFCNSAKNTSTKEEFCEWIKRIKQYYPTLLSKIEIFNNSII